MKCGFLGLMVMCWVGLQSYAQDSDFWQFEGLDTLYRKVEGFGVGLPQEKAYLHLDNTCYFLGDTIWYKGYVTRSDRGTLTDLSKILYVELLTPDSADDQAAVMDVIYNGVKAGDLTHDVAAFRAACEHLLARGAEVLILGCTELPPAFELYHLDYPNVDPTLELALGAIRAAGCETK